MVTRALWVFILVSLVLASQRHWGKILAVITSATRQAAKWFIIIPKMPIKHLLEFHTTHSTNLQLPIPHHTHHCKYSPCSDPPFSFIPCTDSPLTDSTQSSIDTHTLSYPFPSPSSTLFIPLCPRSPTHIYTRFLYPFDLIHAGSSTHTHQTCPLTHFRPSPIIAFSHSTPQSYPYRCIPSYFQAGATYTSIFQCSITPFFLPFWPFHAFSFLNVLIIKLISSSLTPNVPISSLNLSLYSHQRCH